MSIRKSPSEQHEEQLRMRAEDLRGEVDELIEKLDKTLGVDNYVIGADGSLSIKLGELEMSSETKAEVNKIEGRLKRIYKEVKEIGIDIFSKTSSEVIH